MPTREEIDTLKHQWLGDQSWDIEDTPGFEEHHLELLAWRAQQENTWRAREAARVQEKSELLGCPGNLKLVAYVEGLERRLELLERIS
jgi:hypothetical protein